MKKTKSFILFVIAVILTNCSGSHYSTERVTSETLYCGTLKNITQVTKKCSLVKTSATEFIVWGLPDLKPETKCYIEFREEAIRPGLETNWNPYFVANNERFPLRLEFIQESFYVELNKAHLSWVGF